MSTKLNMSKFHGKQYSVEYAKSMRSSCNGCKKKIRQHILRLAAVVMLPRIGREQIKWYHFKCFFNYQRPQSVLSVSGFDVLHKNDQFKITDAIAYYNAWPPPVTDFGIEYATSGRSVCRACETKITKNELRVKKIIYDTEIGMRIGGVPQWYDLECFAESSAKLGWLKGYEVLPGFEKLHVKDQQMICDL